MALTLPVSGADGVVTTYWKVNRLDLSIHPDFDKVSAVVWLSGWLTKDLHDKGDTPSDQKTYNYNYTYSDPANPFGDSNLAVNPAVAVALDLVTKDPDQVFAAAVNDTPVKKAV